MDLSTRYMGLELPHPLISGASPLVDELDTVRRLEDAGAAAIVMNSLFEEEIVYEQISTARLVEEPAHSFAEAQTYLPERHDLSFGPDRYLEKLRGVKEAVDVPVIGSLNGTTLGRWLEYARLIEDAGATALELNLYHLWTDPEQGAAQIEANSLDIVREVRQSLAIPLAVKLSPFYTALAHLAQGLFDVGADALVLFNRFYQPDIDVEELEVARTLHLSSSDELPLRLRWLAILTGRIGGSYAVTGGVHSGLDAVKAVMAGADAVQMVSCLLKNGPEYLAELKTELTSWLLEHGYDSLEQARGSMNLAHCPDPAGYERANYMGILRSWKAEF